MKNRVGVALLLLLLIFSSVLFFSCKRKDKNNVNQSDGNNGDGTYYIFSENTDAVIVLGEGVKSEDITLLLDAYIELYGKMPEFGTADKFSGEHGIIIGKSDVELSRKGYLRLDRQEKTEKEEVGFLIYSDGRSVAICFDEDPFGANAALNDSIDYFVNNYMQNSALSLKSGVVHELVFDVIERQKELDKAAVDERFKTKLSQITRKFGGDSQLASETVDALREMRAMLTEDGDITSWIANLYDPENGGFYYSNSARDNLGYLPDLESTTQALGIISELLSIDYNGSLADFLGDEMVSDLIRFAKSMQDPNNGYFYHPQWSKDLTDQKLNRRGRDVGNAVRILERFGASPTYDTPTGVKGDGILADGTPVSSRLHSPLGKSAVSAVSYVLSVNAEDANVSPHMRTREAFEAYLSGLDINGDYYAVGNTLESQADQFVYRDKTLAERGESYRLADICEEWMTKHQNPETGLWNLDGLCGYSEVNGLLKLGSTYSRLGKKIPNAAKGIQTAIDCMLGEDEELEIICDIFNTWYAISLVTENVETYGSPSEYDEVIAIKNSIYQNYPAMIRATTKKVRVFKKNDGSYSFTPMYSSYMSQGMTVAVQNSVEGDVNATMIASISIPGTIYSYLGIGKVPIFTPSDRMIFKSIMDDMGYIIKNEMPAVQAVDFEDEKSGFESDYVETVINSSGSALVEKREDGKGKALRFISSSDGASVGSDEVQFYTSTNWFGAPCNILDLDLCVLPDTDDGYFAQLSLYPNMYMLGLHKDGDRVWLTEESSWTASNSFTHDLGVEAGIGEWFNLRIEFYTGSVSELRIKVYFNGNCVVVSNNYFDAQALKLTGQGKAPMQYDFGRLLIMSTSNADVLIDNVTVDQNVSAYEPEVDPLDQPLRNVDAPQGERIEHEFHINNGETVAVPTNHIGGGANSARVSFNLTVDGSSANGAKYAINFKEFENLNVDLVSLHLLVKESGTERYAVFCEAALGVTGTEYDYVKIPLGQSVKVELHFFFDESAVLVFVDGELVGINGSVASGQRRFYYGNVEIKSLTADVTSSISIDGLYSERIKDNYEKLSAPAVERVTHEFDRLDGIETDGIAASGGVLDLSSSNGGYVKIPVNSRSNIATFGLASVGVLKNNGSGYFTLALSDASGNYIAAFDVVATERGALIYERTANGRYKTPIAEVATSAFTLSVEYSPAKESFNILIGESCVTVSSLNYKKGSVEYDYLYLVISCDSAAPFAISSAVAETSAALFKPYSVTLANDDSSAAVMTYETSNFASLPSRVTKSFVSSGSDLRVRESNVFGEISKVLEFSTRSGGNDILTFAPTKAFGVGNAIVFETDMMISAKSGAYVDIEPMSSGTRAYQLRIYSPSEGGIIIASSKDFSKKIAREGEWFKLRLEYTKTSYDYNYDGKSDIIFRLYVNGELIVEGYTPYTGDGFEASSVNRVRLFTHNGTVADYSFDNTRFEQFDMEYEAPEEYIPDDPSILSYNSGVVPSQISFTLASEKSDYSIVEDTVSGEVSKVLKFTTSAGGNDYLTFAPTRNAEEFNAVALETYIKINTKEGLYVDIQPMAEGKTAYQVRLYAKPNGGIINASSSDFSKDIASEGEWFKLRIEYANTEYDFNYDGYLDVLVRVYVNEALVDVGYTPFYGAGQGADESKVSVFRFFTHNGSVGDIYFEDTVFEQFTMAYDAPPPYVQEDPTVLSFESGVMPSQVSFNKASENGAFGIVEKNVGDEVSKVLKFTTSKGGNDYFTVKTTETIEGSNALRFETDIMISPTSSSQFAIEPLTSGSSRAFRLIVTATPDGTVTVYSESERSVSFTLGNSDEWVHLRIDYMNPKIDYNFDGTADILYKIYVNGAETPVAVGYAPYRAGEVYDPTSLASVRFFAFGDADCDVFLDNTSLKQVTLTPDEAPKVEEPEPPVEPDPPAPPETPDDPEVSPETPTGPGHEDGENLYDPDGWGNK